MARAVVIQRLKPLEVSTRNMKRLDDPVERWPRDARHPRDRRDALAVAIVERPQNLESARDAAHRSPLSHRALRPFVR